MTEYLVSKLSELLGQNEYLFTYDLIEFLGSVNVILAVIAGSLYLLRRVNKYGFNHKNATLKKLLKPLATIHPYIGVALLFSAYFHGDLALGTIFRFHTGTIAWWILLGMMLLGTIGKRYKVKNWRKMHQIGAILFVLSVLIHLTLVNLI